MVILDNDLVEDGLESTTVRFKEKSGQNMLMIVLTNFRKGHARTELVGQRHWTFVKKPINRAILRNTVRGMLNQIRMPNAIHYLRHREKYIYGFHDIIAASPAMRSVLNLVEKVASSHSNVLITGEIGTGKELIAAAIHYNSPRHHENFVTVNGLSHHPETLESELFGQEADSDESGNGRRTGRIEQANGGTLFLKRICSLDLTTQAKILRVIRHKEYERVGGKQRVKADICLICSAWQDLKSRIQQGQFREELFYRINVINIHLPPLRERKEDIPALAQFFLHKYRNELGRPELGFAPKTIERLMEYNWPGNVAELETVVKRALYVATGDQIEPHDVPVHARPLGDPGTVGMLHGDNLNLDLLERAALIEAMKRTSGVQKEAARLLGISPRVIHYKLHKHNLVT